MGWIESLLIGIAAAMLGGIASGLQVGRKDLGGQLAAFFGAFYGFLGGAVAVGGGIGILYWLGALS